MLKLQFLKFFDFFGYIPQFRIKGSEKYTSKFGGFVFLIFVILAFSLIIFQMYYFVNTINDVLNSMLVYHETRNTYYFTRKDTYFGVSLRDSNGESLNLTKYPYFDFVFSSFNYNNEVIIDYDKCDIAYFLYPDDQKSLNNRESVIKSLMSDYICISDFHHKIQPTVFQLESYFSLKVIVKEKYKFDPIFKDFMEKIKPRVSFIYSNSNYNSMSKFKPYFSKIDETIIDLDNRIIKTCDFSYMPFETLDNDGLFFSGFKYFNNTIYSKQENGTVFQLNREGDTFKVLNPSDPENTLLNFRLNLSDRISQNYRSFKNIQNLINIVSSFIPNIYLAFLLFANTVNKVKGKNVLMGIVYSKETIYKIKEFQKDHKVRRNSATRNSHLKTIKSNKFKINLDTPQNHIEFKEKSKNLQLVDKETHFKNLDDLFEDEQPFKFTFIDYFKSFFKKDSKSKMMKKAYLKFDEAIEIDAYLYLKQEFEFYKELFMDNYQRLVFETASKYKNFQKLFELDDLKLEEANLTIQQSISKIYERKNENDEILINFLEN